MIEIKSTLKKKKIICIIPARFNSKRFPGKPLAKILGVPMLLRTYNQCLKVVNKDQIFIATDDNRIKNLCLKNNINFIITSKKCLTSTDRVVEISRKFKYKNFVNIQGDEPIFNPNDLKKIILATVKDPSFVYAGYCKIDDSNQYRDFSIPKLVFNKNNDLIYTSRASIPSNKKNKFHIGYRQVCLYSYPIKLLNKLNKKKSLLEKLEDLELLRFLDSNIIVKMIKMSSRSISVDSPKDIKKVIKRIKGVQKVL